MITDGKETREKTEKMKVRRGEEGFENTERDQLQGR